MKPVFSSIVSALVLAAASLQTPAVAADKQNLSLIQLRSYIVVPAGVENKLFENDKLDLGVKIVGDNLLINEAIASGTSDVAITGTTYQALAAENLGYSIIAIAEQSPAAVGIIAAADSNIEKLEDLRGKTIGGGDGKAIAYVQEALADVGIQSGDYKYLKIESSAGAAALASKQIDAWITYNPFIASAVSNGIAKVVFTPTSKYFNNFVVVLATKDAIANKPAELAEFLKSYKQSLDWVTANPADAVAIYAKATTLDPKVAEVTFAKRNQLFEAPGADVVADLSREAQLYVKYGLIASEPDWSKVVDTSIWKRAFGE
jgi:sulfonate transport system substrate-binding protein